MAESQIDICGEIFFGVLNRKLGTSRSLRKKGISSTNTAVTRLGWTAYNRFSAGNLRGKEVDVQETRNGRAASINGAHQPLLSSFRFLLSSLSDGLAADGCRKIRSQRSNHLLSTVCFHAWPRPRKSSWVKISGISEHHEI